MRVDIVQLIPLSDKWQVFIPTYSRRPVCQQDGPQNVHVEMENRKGDAGSIFLLRFSSCIAFSSGAFFCAF